MSIEITIPGGERRRLMTAGKYCPENIDVEANGGSKLLSIAITTPPNKTTYATGERFDPAGMEVMAVYSNGETLPATGYEVEPNGDLPADITSVTIRCTEGGVTVTAVQEIRVLSFDPVLNNNSFEQISIASRNGIARSIWRIGDRKTVVLNGTLGQVTFDHLTVYAFIVGFDHNSDVEGKNLTHFELAKTALTGGDDLAFCDSAFGGIVPQRNYFAMNYANTNAGGWAGSEMRTNICGTSPQSGTGTMMSVIPAELREVIRPVIKYTDNTGNNNTAAAITATTDYFFLYSEYELMGEIVEGNQNEANMQRQYAYYMAGNSKVKKDHRTLSTTPWWTRSPIKSNSRGFTLMIGDEPVVNRDGNTSRGVVPCFCV